MEKASTDESEARVNQIIKMLSEGVPRRGIIEFCRKKYNLKTAQIYIYLNKAEQYVKDLYGDEFKKALVSKQIMQLENLYFKNMQNEDFRECRAIIESLSKMLGLNEAVKLDVTTLGKEISNSITVEIIKPLNYDDED